MNFYGSRRKIAEKLLSLALFLAILLIFPAKLSFAQNSFVSPVPNYPEVKILSKSANSRAPLMDLANLSFPVLALSLGGLWIWHRRKKDKSLRRIDFIDPGLSRR